MSQNTQLSVCWYLELLLVSTTNLAFCLSMVPFSLSLVLSFLLRCEVMVEFGSHFLIALELLMWVDAMLLHLNNRINLETLHRWVSRIMIKWKTIFI